MPAPLCRRTFSVEAAGDRGVGAAAPAQCEDLAYDVELLGDGHHPIAFPIGFEAERRVTGGLSVLTFPGERAACALGDQLPLHLREATEQGQDEPTVRGRRVEALAHRVKLNA